MKKIPLTRGKHTIVDDEDFCYLSQWKWCLSSAGYAIRNSRKKEGKRRQILMHRVVNKTPKGLETDHINRNRLDNRKKNLRSVTSGQNKFNRSGLNGISWNKTRGKWYAYITVNNKMINLGLYSIFEVAVFARLMGEKIFWGDIYILQ